MKKNLKEKKDLREHKYADHKLYVCKTKIQTELKQHSRLSIKSFSNLFQNMTRYIFIDVHKIAYFECPDCGKSLKNNMFYHTCSYHGAWFSNKHVHLCLFQSLF